MRLAFITAGESGGKESWFPPRQVKVYGNEHKKQSARQMFDGIILPLHFPIKIEDAHKTSELPTACNPKERWEALYFIKLLADGLVSG